MKSFEIRQPDIRNLDFIIQTRRSIFPEQYIAGEKIPDEIIMQLLENANWAPTHKQTEPWHFVIFTEAGLERFARFQAALYEKTASEKFRLEKYQKMLSTPLLCSHIIAIGMRRSGSIPEIEEIESVACAVQNLFLSVRAHGLGGYWSTGGVTYEPEAKPFFGLREQDKLLGFFYLGYIKTPPTPGKRRPIVEKINWVKE